MQPRETLDIYTLHTQTHALKHTCTSMDESVIQYCSKESKTTADKEREKKPKSGCML